METPRYSPFFSSVCVERCKGVCCDPWWGIISFQMVKTGGLSNLDGFREELLRALRLRMNRIKDAYRTREKTPRPIFSDPERYDVKIRSMRSDGDAVELNVIAMFAFRCAYLGADKSCLIHPAITGRGDIRPSHCAYLGILKAGPGEKGHCRVIHVAESPVSDVAGLDAAIEAEKGISRRAFNEAAPSLSVAADRVIEALKDRLRERTPATGPAKEAPVKDLGRNDPCWCGSGRKFKKCHGR